MSFQPKFNLIKELEWRGILHQHIPGTEELLMKECVSGYVGFDPTADSLHIGNMVPIILLVHLQRAGHKPIALVGGATGMVGDPSGKKAERSLLDMDTIEHNLSCQKKQLTQFLDFDNDTNSAEVVNNYDWFKNISFLDFIRDVGKHITINYMLAKDSVKNRMEEGMSFTEFTYQLVQGFDFFHLWKEKNVKLQMGGSDQWGNIVTGTELIRRKGDGSAFALTAPLVTKSDGSKFGKSEGGNIWLDPKKTSPFQFYQFWLQLSDEDAVKYLKIFTLWTQEEINSITNEHLEAPHLRLAQKKLATYVTEWVHGKVDLEKALKATVILFGASTKEDLLSLNDQDIKEIFDGVKQGKLSQMLGLPIIDLLTETGFIQGRKEAGRALAENSIMVNNEKVNQEFILSSENLIAGKYVLLQRGKKNKFLAINQ